MTATIPKEVPRSVSGPLSTTVASPRGPSGDKQKNLVIIQSISAKQPVQNVSRLQLSGSTLTRAS